jgi:hypothetical protein
VVATTKYPGGEWLSTRTFSGTHTNVAVIDLIMYRSLQKPQDIVYSGDFGQ